MKKLFIGLLILNSFSTISYGQINKSDILCNLISSGFTKSSQEMKKECFKITENYPLDQNAIILCASLGQGDDVLDCLELIKNNDYNFSQLTECSKKTSSLWHGRNHNVLKCLEL